MKGKRGKETGDRRQETEDRIFNSFISPAPLLKKALFNDDDARRGDDDGDGVELQLAPD